MEYFLYSVEMPFSGTRIFYRDISSKEQLILSKANVLLPENEDTYLEYAKVIKDIVSNCIENKKDFYELNIIEYILFITKLRILSIGSIIELVFKNSEDEFTKNSKISIDLNIFMKLLFDAANDCMKNSILEVKDFTITLDWPSVKSENLFLNEEKNIYIHILSTIQEYIKTISTKEYKIDLKEFNHEQKLEIYESLPISVKTKIQTFIFNSIENIAQKNLFGLKKMDYFKFNLYNKSYQHIIRLFFTEPLKNIYQEYYALASKNINPLYVDNISISDRRVFCSFIEEEIKNRKESESESSNNNENSSNLEDLMDEFGE